MCDHWISGPFFVADRLRNSIYVWQLGHLITKIISVDTYFEIWIDKRFIFTYQKQSDVFSLKNRFADVKISNG